MSVLIISIDNAERNGAFYFTVDLEGKTYLFEFQFNSREGFWYFDVSQNGERIRSGVKVVANFPSMLRCKDLNRLPGQIIFVDSRTEAGQPTFEELGKEVLMTYIESSSLPS
jgi:hypothetical protein